MSLVKTDKGREALQRRDVGLNPRERQIIVLANGKLNRTALAELMHHDIHDTVERLIAGGYLVQEVASTRTASPTQPPQQSSARRSLAGTKMYITDMLQLLRNMDASAMAVTVHTSQGETEFMCNVIAAARLIAHTSGPSYGMRVVAKLREIVPEPHLTALNALTIELEAGLADA